MGLFSPLTITISFRAITSDPQSVTLLSSFVGELLWGWEQNQNIVWSMTFVLIFRLNVVFSHHTA